MRNRFFWDKERQRIVGDVQSDKINNEYDKIDRDWLTLHYKTSIALAIFAFIVECFMGMILVNSDMLNTTVQKFVYKFIVVPSVLDFLCIITNTIVIKSKYFSQNQKIYTVSLIFVVICFVLFTVHSAFTSTYYIFGLAIVITVIYASYSVTNITAIASIVALCISEIFIKWDVDKTSIFDSTLRLGNFLISFFVLIAFSMVCMVAIHYERKKNQASIQIEMERHLLQQSAQVDEMTGVFNRKALHNALKEMEEKEGDNHYILAIADIDYFKGINDKWGHHIGDLCIIEFAKILQSKSNSETVTAFRYGGDEFCLLFCNVQIDEAVLICNDIKKRLNSLQIENNLMLKLTVSIGLAEYSKQLDASRLFIHSDTALYQAKEVRNTIQVFTMKPETSLLG